MKGLRVIPMFLVLILFSYVGALFVERNPDPVSINFLRFVTPPAKLGLVVLSSLMLGMIAAGLLCSIELLALFVQNKNLRRKLNQMKAQMAGPNSRPGSPTGTTEIKELEETTNTSSFNRL